MAQSVTETRRKSGWWYPWIFVGMFGIVIAVNSVLAYFATSTFNGLETENAFEEGVAYNSTIAMAEAQELLGWTFALEHQALGEINAEGLPAEVRLVYKDINGEPVTGLAVRAQIRRPTQAGYDFTTEFQERSGGVYAALISLPMIGQWEVRALAKRDADEFRLKERFVIK